MRDGNLPLIDGYPQALWRERCTNVWVGVLYEVSSTRASNWHYYGRGTIYCDLYNDADAFHRTRHAAETQVEGQRSRGASWRITEWPCLVAANNRGSVSVVQMNTNRPFANWNFEYGRGTSLGSVAACWANEADERRRDWEPGFKYCSFAHMFVNTPDLECQCGKYLHPMYQGHTCEKCLAVVSRSRTNRKEDSAPPIRKLTAPCTSYHSHSWGGGFELAWYRSKARPLDFEPAFSLVSQAIMHLDNS